MSRPVLAIAAILVLSAAASGCAPQCTCPNTIPAPVGPPPDATAPGAIPAPAPAPVGGPLRIINDEEAEAQMRSLYPRQLADVGVGADAIMEVTIDANGTVLTARDVRVTNDHFRGAALSVAHALQFTAPPAAGTVVRVMMRWRTTRTSVEIMQP